MQMRVITSTAELTEVALDGRADSAGVAKVEQEFNTLVLYAKGTALVDLSQVGFLASLGIRMLVAAAKSLNRRGGRLLLHSAQELVAQTLRDTGIDSMIPLLPDQPSALAAARSPAA